MKGIDKVKMKYRFWPMIFMFALALGAVRSASSACCPDSSSIPTTYAGTGSSSYTGDNGPATLASFDNPWGVAVDSSGNLYVADSTNNVVRKISATGIVTTFAGTGTSGFSGDTGPATLAKLSDPNFVAVDPSGNVYINEFANNRIRKVTPGGTITTFAGNGSTAYAGDGGPATLASFKNPYGVSIDAAGNVYISDNNCAIRKVDTAGNISTIAGTGTCGYSGDNGPATLAQIEFPDVPTSDAAGNVYFWDDGNGRLRKVDISGTITTVGGTGTTGFSGDNGPATLAQMGDTEGIAFCNGNIYLTSNQGRIRMINSAGIISTVLATGSYEGCAIDGSGNLFTSTGGANQVLKLSPACSTATPPCGLLYSDNFTDAGTLSNYVVTQRQANTVSVAIAGGELVVTAPGSGLGGAEILVSNSVLSNSVSNYTEEFDASIDALSGGYGDFGAAFRGSTTGDYYGFLWNGNPENSPPHWQAVDFHTTGAGYTYLGGSSFGGGQTSPTYTPGNWAHYKVVCNGTSIQCSVDVNDGTGPHLVYNFTDGTYSAGNAGFHADFLQNGNHARFRNLVIYTGLCATPTPLPSGCTQFTDTYPNSGSLGNYSFYNNAWNASTAGGQSYQVSSNELQAAPSSSTVYSYAIANSGSFNSSLGDYTVEGDFKLGTAAQGLFGLVFRADPALAHAYIFQWNGLNGRWEIEKQTLPNGTGYYYPGCNSSNPYTLGTWVHLKVTASGGNFNAWETPESAPGVPNGTTVQIFTNVADTVACTGISGLTAPYMSGAVGLRAYNIVAGNTLQMANFTSTTCSTTGVYPGSNQPGAGEFFIYPSPARGSQATVSYNMAQAGQVDLRVWNEKAELVTHVTDSKPAGVQITPFSIAGFGTGVYFYSVTLTYSSGQVEKLGPKKFAILH